MVWLLGAYTRTITKSMAPLPTWLRLVHEDRFFETDPLIHSSFIWVVLWEHGWVALSKGDYSIFSYHLCFCVLIRLFKGLTSLGFSSLNTTVYLSSLNSTICFNKQFSSLLVLYVFWNVFLVAFKKIIVQY